MKYSFDIEKNVHMYNHLLKCTDGRQVYRALCESAPEREPTLLIWPEDFGIPEEDRQIFQRELRRRAAVWGYRCIFYPGKGR